MDYTQMSLVELKQHAKERKIKQYYVMKRLQLIQLLSMPDLPMSFKIEKMTIHQLRDEAKRKGIRGFWTLHRDELVELLYPTDGASQQENENRSQQQSPNNSKAEEVRL
jgi:Rho termination factor, N-terminal domain.